MAISTLATAMMALLPYLLLILFPLAVNSSLSGYSAEIEDQSIITIYDAYPKPFNPKAYAAAPRKVGFMDHCHPFFYHFLYFSTIHLCSCTIEELLQYHLP